MYDADAGAVDLKAAPQPRASDSGAGDGSSGVGAVWSRYEAFLRRRPEMVLEWNDDSGARGWLVCNSLRGGAAGGGTRMQAGLTRDEVTYLAKVMELKFAISGPPIGGAKSGIDFDPRDPRKAEVLALWFEAIEPELRSRYGTAGDLNVDIQEVVARCSALGLGHPQEGVVRGHLGLRDGALDERLSAMREGMGMLVGGEEATAWKSHRVVDLVTGYGVAAAARRLLALQGRELAGARVLIEGFGCVGGSAALYLSRWGGRIVGIVDDRSGLVSDRGLDHAAIETLLRAQVRNELPAPPGSGAARESFWSMSADLLVTAAASGTVTAARLAALEHHGVHSIVCGGNRPFAAASAGDMTLERDADGRFAIAADFVANCGVACAFAQLMGHRPPRSSRDVFAQAEATIIAALDEAAARAGSSDRGLLAGALSLALDRCLPGDGEAAAVTAE